MTGEINVVNHVNGLIDAANLPPTEQADLLRILNQYALECYVLDSTKTGSDEVAPETEEGRDPTPFGEINDPKHFLGYEHMDDFQQMHAEEFPSFTLISKMFAAVAYSRKPPVLTTSGGRSPGVKINDPRTVGLIGKTRDQVGFPRLPRSIARNRNQDVIQRVVQVGSFIMFAGLLRIPSFREEINNMTNPDRTEHRAVIVAAGDLTRQIDQARAA